MMRMREPFKPKIAASDVQGSNASANQGWRFQDLDNVDTTLTPALVPVPLARECHS